MPFAFGSFGGCVISLVLVSFFRGQIKWIIFGSSFLMTVGCGALAAARVDNIGEVYFILLLAGLGVGGIVVPASMITTLICPSDLIATVTALTIAIRIVGGAVGYAIYYNVFANKLVPEMIRVLGAACYRVGITDSHTIAEIVELTTASMIDVIPKLPGVTPEAAAEIIAAGQVAYANVYPWVYYCSVAFGSLAIIASVFLEDISKFIDDRVAVVL